MKALVAFFSASGITKAVAHTLAEAAEADIYMRLSPKIFIARRIWIGQMSKAAQA